MKKGVISLILLFIAQLGWAQFNLCSGQSVTLACDKTEAQVVQTALKLFACDYQSVFSAPAITDTWKGDIIVGTVGKTSLVEATGVDLSCLKDKKQAFLLTVLPDGKLLVAGSDAHGTDYGIMELSLPDRSIAVGMVGGCGAGKKDIFYFTRRLPKRHSLLP